jgi:hypothetical protein
MKNPAIARLVASFIGCMVVQLAPRDLLAESADVGVRYQAPNTCPTEQDFFAKARWRNPRIGAPISPEPPQLLVTIEPGTTSPFVGRLERVTATGTVGVREIQGETCDELATALALITAVTGDLLARSDERTVVAGSESAALLSAGSSDEARPERDAQVQPTGAAGVRWQTGASGMLATGVTDRAIFGGGAFVQLSARTSATWAPSARLSLSYARSSWTSPNIESGAQADFTRMMASVDGCPVQLGDPLNVSVQPCVRASAGRLTASGTGRPAGPAQESALWLDVGVLARGHWQVTGAAFVDLETALVFPLQRYAFAFDRPSEVVYSEPFMGVQVAAGMGILFR